MTSVQMLITYRDTENGGTAPTPKDAFDRAELIEDFEYPICQICMGIGMVRDENGINMVTCHYCEGEGRAPVPE